MTFELLEFEHQSQAWLWDHSTIDAYVQSEIYKRIYLSIYIYVFLTLYDTFMELARLEEKFKNELDVIVTARYFVN